MSRQGSDHLRCVGASRPHRDSRDARVIKELHRQPGQVGVLGDHEPDFSEHPKSAVRQSWADTDRDGMPYSWEGGQTFEVCIDNDCDTHYNLDASGTFTAKISSNGVYQFTMTLVSADAVRDKSIEGSLNLKIEQD